MDKSNWFKNSSPEHETKRKIKKMAAKKMGGNTARERFANFFLNRNGYYSWREMMINWLLVIVLVLLIVSTIFCLVNLKNLSIATLIYNPLFITFAVSGGALLFLGIEKLRCRKHRINCFLNNGISTKYVFWKDDKTNPKNKGRKTGFE